MTRTERWEKILKNNGYEVVYKKFAYWDNVLHAKKEGVEIPIAVVDFKNGSACLIAKSIIASEENFRNLISYYTLRDTEPISYKLVWKDKNSCNIKLQEV